MCDDRNINTNTVAWITQNRQKLLIFNEVWQLRIAEEDFFVKKGNYSKINMKFSNFQVH